MKTQMDSQKLAKDYSSEIVKLQEELKYNDQVLASYGQELQYTKEHLHKVRFI